jgi:hypothetical protein
MHLFARSATRVLGAGAVAGAAQASAHWNRGRADDVALRKCICAHELLASALVTNGKSCVILCSLGIDALRGELFVRRFCILAQCWRGGGGGIAAHLPLAVGHQSCRKNRVRDVRANFHQIWAELGTEAGQTRGSRDG